MILLAAALAAPQLESLAPLAPCKEDGFPFTLLQRVEAVEFRADGLWVADAGSLSRRGPTLELREQVQPGTTGWVGLLPEGAHTEAWTWTPEGLRRGRPERVEPERPWSTAYAIAGNLQAEAHTRLTVRDRGQVVADQVLLDGVETVGTLEGRLFTLAGGELRLWDGDGPRSEALPGHWSGAAALDGQLLLVDRQGALARYDGTQVNSLGCLQEPCEAPPAPLLPAPRPHSPPEAYAAVVLDWVERQTAWRAEHAGHALELVVAGERVVVREAGGLQVGTVDRRGRVRHRQVELPPASGPRLALDGDAVRIVDDDGPVPLAPRAWPQQARAPYGVPFGGGLLVADREPGGLPVQLVCPVPGGPPLVDPGRLATLTDGPAPRRAGLRPIAPGTYDTGPWASPGQAVLRWVDPDLRQLPASLVGRTERVVVQSLHPAPDDLPADVRWSRLARARPPAVTLAWQGVVVWSSRDTAPPPIPTTPHVPDVLPVRRPFRLDPVAAAEEALWVAEQSGSSDVQQAAEHLLSLDPSSKLARLTLLRGHSLPGLPRTGEVVVLVGDVPPDVAWHLADQLRRPLVLLDDATGPVPPGVTRVPRGARLPGIPPRAYLLLKDGQVVWTGTDRRRIPLNQPG